MLLGLDFGGTKLTAVAHDPATQARYKLARQPAAPAAEASDNLETMRQLAREVLDGHAPRAIGISFGGPVDAARGIVKQSDHVPSWENIPLAAVYETQFGVPVRLDNDANVGALGEYHFGAGRGQRDLMYITVSTGVGGGILLNGRVWHGADSMAGEIGHTIADPDGPLCLCGRRGCVERLASGPYMARDYQQRRALTIPVTGQQVAQYAREGDPIAQQLLQRGAQAIGRALGNTANLLNLPLFILGGGVTKAGELWWQGVRQTAEATARDGIQFEIVPAALGDDAPLWGAIVLAKSSLESVR